MYYATNLATPLHNLLENIIQACLNSIDFKYMKLRKKVMVKKLYVGVGMIVLIFQKML